MGEKSNALLSLPKVCSEFTRRGEWWAKTFGVSRGPIVELPDATFGRLLTDCRSFGARGARAAKEGLAFLT